MQEIKNTPRIVQLYELIETRIRKRIQANKHINITLIIAFLIAIPWFYMPISAVLEDGIIVMVAFFGICFILFIVRLLSLIRKVTQSSNLLEQICILNTVYLRHLNTLDSFEEILSQVEQIHKSMNEIGILKKPQNTSIEATHIHDFTNAWEEILSKNKNIQEGGNIAGLEIDKNIQVPRLISLPELVAAELEYLYLILLDLRSDLATRLTEQRQILEGAKTKVENTITGTPELLAVSEAQQVRLDRQIEQFEDLQRVLVRF